jgi:hypothetical protein
MPSYRPCMANNSAGTKLGAASVKDDTSSVLVVLNEGIFLKDANDGVYGNPLLAGFLSEHYKADELRLFVDYWTEEPLLLKSE